MAGTTIGSATTLSAGYANSTPRFTLTNLGIIGGPGVGLQGVNAAVANSGIVTGSSNGVAFASAGASVTNFSGGTITGATDGIGFNSGGTLINLAGGTIAGGFNGVAIYNGVGFVANSGTISGSVGRAVVFQNSVANRLVMYPGAVFIGGAYGGSAGTSILELGSAAAIGTVSGIGSSYTRFGRITLDPGAYWHFTGTNTASTLISSGYLVNDGTIGGTVTVASGELINNNAASRISASTGVVITGAGAALMNAGQIIGDPAAGIGVSLQANGQVLNYGTISGLDGVAGAASVGGTVTNGGSITGGFGIALAGGAAVTNKIGGVIIGTSGAGVSFGHGGQLLNRQGAIITGGDGIGALGAATTVENAGTISGTAGSAITLAPGYANRVVVDPGAVFAGKVDGGNAVGSSIASTLELALSGTAAGTISGLGTQFVDFAQIVADAGASWLLSGKNNVAGGVTLTGNGTLTNIGSLGGTVTLVGALTNAATGTISGSPGLYGSPVHTETVVNAGSISGGVWEHGGGLVSNQSGGTISGYQGIAIDTPTATVVNAGAIAGQGSSPNAFGILLTSGGQVTNQAGGTLSGTMGVRATGGSATVTNSGGITGSGGTAVSLPGGFANRVVMTPAATFTGKVDGGNTLGSKLASTLELAFGATLGTLNGFGSQFTGFNQIAVDPGAYWVSGAANHVAPGIAFLDAGNLTNAGSIGGGVTVTASNGALTNVAGGTISGIAVTSFAPAAVLANSGDVATVVNDGLITDTSPSTVGIQLDGGGSITNQSNGAIFGAFIGIALVAGEPTTISNAGSIGGGNAAIDGLGATNATIVNSGTIGRSGFYTVYLHDGSITNLAGGTITGGVSADGSATIANAGSIAAADTAHDAVALKSGSANRVILAPGGVFSGKVDGGNTIGSSIVSTLELGSGASQGTLSGFGSQYANFAAIAIDQGASWTLGSADTIGSGTSLSNGGVLHETVTIAANGVLSNAATGTITAATGVVLAAATGVLTNAGLIAGDPTAGTGVRLPAGGSFNNVAGGTITGHTAVAIAGTVTSTVNNFGSIAGDTGVAMVTPGTVGNYAGGVISASASGVALLNGGVVFTYPRSTITGAYGVRITNAAGTIVEDGSIIGTGGTAIALAGGFANTVILGSGSPALTGLVDGGNKPGGSVVSTLALADASNGTVPLYSTISGLGSRFVDFAYIIDRAKQTNWKIVGDNTILAGQTLAAGVPYYLFSLPPIATGSLTNFGLISGYPNARAGLWLETGAVLVNEPGGTVNGVAAQYAVLPVKAGAVTIDNAGTITRHIGNGIGDYGVYLHGGGSVTNRLGAIITGSTAAIHSGAHFLDIFGLMVDFRASAAIANAGLVAATYHAVALIGGGTLVNQATGTLASSFPAVSGTSIDNAYLARSTPVYAIEGSTTLVNAGRIAGNNGSSVLLGSGYANLVEVQPGATFVGAVNGGNSIGSSIVSTLELAAGSTSGTITSISAQYIGFGRITIDAGADWTLAGTNTLSNGVDLSIGGTLRNSGVLTGAPYGLPGTSAGGAVFNSGSIGGASSGSGIQLELGGSVTNLAGGTITGGYGIRLNHGTGMLVNSGLIAGSHYGVSLPASGSVTNLAGGTIKGGIDIGGGAGTVVNAGSIGPGAGNRSVVLDATATDLVVVEPGGTFAGSVDAGSTQTGSTLELGAGSGAAVISGIGTQFRNFVTLAVDAGANWSVQGSNTIQSIGEQGALTIASAAQLSTGTTMTVSSGSLPAQVIVTGTGRLTDSAPLILGDASGGSLLLGNGGSASATTLTLGNRVAGEGALTADDGAFTASGAIAIGAAGAGHLRVAHAGTVASGSAGIGIGLAAGATGDVLAAGAASLLDSAGSMVVGDQGLGSLAIQAGATVVAAGGGAAIASQAGSDGSAAAVTGPGSNWQVTGALQVGGAAAGSLAITAGGSASAGDMIEGAFAGGSGNVSVIGAGSTLALTGQLTVGNAGAAELSILNGGAVSAANGAIGPGAGSSGNVDIEGAGSHLDIANDLHIGGAGIGVLTLGNGTELTVADNLIIGANGVLNQFGGSIDPSTITIVSGGRQGGHGTSTASALISNAGTLFASGGTETVVTPLITAPSGKSGVLEIDAAGDLVLNVGSVDATQSVTFTDGTGILTIGTIGGFAASIVGVNAGDQIIVQGRSIASDSFNASSHVLTLFDGSSATIGTLQLGPSVDGTAVLANGTGGLSVAPCFAAGTRISTERAEVAVEDLRIGDRVQVVPLHPHPNPLPLRGRGSSVAAADGPLLPLRRSGGGLGWGCSQPITWIGHRTVDCTRHPEPRKVYPVRVAAHALGRNRPARDLYLSPDHALYLNNVLIPVKHLVNGTTIVQTSVDTVTYYHVELPAHAILLAENLPAESYLDTGDRCNFANAAGPVVLHPDFASRQWEADGCAPLVVTGAELDAVRRWINYSAEAGTSVSRDVSVPSPRSASVSMRQAPPASTSAGRKRDLYAILRLSGTQ